MSKALVFAGLVMTALFPVPASARTTEVVVDKMAFGVVPSNLSVGDTIVWTNKDIGAHTVTSSAGAFDSNLIPPGGSWKYRRRNDVRLLVNCTTAWVKFFLL